MIIIVIYDLLISTVLQIIIDIYLKKLVLSFLVTYSLHPNMAWARFYDEYKDYDMGTKPTEAFWRLFNAKYIDHIPYLKVYSVSQYSILVFNLDLTGGIWSKLGSRWCKLGFI